MATDAQEVRLMTIGEAARTIGVATPTLRYYEQEGLLSPTTRSRAGYRLYDAQALEQLRFIRSAQTVGFTLDDIRALGRLDGESGKTCKAEVRRLLEQRLARVTEKMKDLRRVQQALGLRPGPLSALEWRVQSAKGNPPRRKKKEMMVTLGWTHSAAALMMLGVVTLGAVKPAAATTERADCLRKIVCPETGKLICRDKCPTIDRKRPDCPGRVVCTLTGQLVCKDRCPVGDAATKNADTKAKPSCCRRG